MHACSRGVVFRARKSLCNEFHISSVELSKLYVSTADTLSIKSVLKMLPLSWSENILTKSIRPFQRGTMDVCWYKGCKVAVHQSWGWSPHLDPEPGLPVYSGPSSRIFFKPSTLRFVTLQSFNLKRPRVYL